MILYEFGPPGSPTSLCLPGNFKTHRQFENLVPLPIVIPAAAALYRLVREYINLIFEGTPDHV